MSDNTFKDDVLTDEDCLPFTNEDAVDDLDRLWDEADEDDYYFDEPVKFFRKRRNLIIGIVAGVALTVFAILLIRALRNREKE